MSPQHGQHHPVIVPPPVANFPLTSDALEALLRKIRDDRAQKSPLRTFWQRFEESLYIVLALLALFCFLCLIMSIIPF